MRKIVYLISMVFVFLSMNIGKSQAGSICDGILYLPCAILYLPTVLVGTVVDGVALKSSSYSRNDDQRTAQASANVNIQQQEAITQRRRDANEPASLGELTSIRKENTIIDNQSPLPLDIRGDAIKEAALSYGARGGLAWRTWHIRQELEQSSRYMDKIYDFRQLLIPAPSGLLIEPPVISEAMDAILIDNQGMDAALADRVLSINKNARIVTASRTWRFYLEREWGEDVPPPPDILRPTTPAERANWARYVTQGWNSGIDQANEIFQADLNRLTADFKGMVRYRELLAQGMVSPPYTSQVYRGVTGDGNTMRVGDRALEITDLPQLQTGSEKWQPASR